MKVRAVKFYMKICFHRRRVVETKLEIKQLVEPNQQFLKKIAAWENTPFNKQFEKVDWCRMKYMIFFVII